MGNVNLKTQLSVRNTANIQCGGRTVEEFPQQNYFLPPFNANKSTQEVETFLTLDGFTFSQTICDNRWTIYGYETFPRLNTMNIENLKIAYKRFWKRWQNWNQIVGNHFQRRWNSHPKKGESSLPPYSLFFVFFFRFLRNMGSNIKCMKRLYWKFSFMHFPSFPSSSNSRFPPCLYQLLNSKLFFPITRSQRKLLFSSILPIPENVKTFSTFYSSTTIYSDVF